MRTAAIAIGAFLLLLVASASAQEGHPLKGTWRGVITEGDVKQPLVMIMDYDGENITGMIDPGRNSYRFSSAELDAPKWTLTVTARTRGGIDIGFEAVLMDIGARNRYLEGTWTQEGNSYPFKVFRE